MWSHRVGIAYTNASGVLYSITRSSEGMYKASVHSLLVVLHVLLKSPARRRHPKRARSPISGFKSSKRPESIM